ncbi:MAG: helix-turn-helix transcriptional regulator [Planctomycetes bacterium]|nr:helix-turn-helix transcriptional regulator [Planctomycetota bacterium]
MNARLGGCYRMGSGTQGAQFRCGIVFDSAGTAERGFVTPQYAVVYVVEGRGWYADGRGPAQRIGPGDVYQRFPSRRHDVTWERTGLRCYLAVPCQVFELFALTGVANLTRPVFHAGTDRRLVREFSELRDELGGCPDGRLMELLVRMQDFLLRLHARGRARDCEPAKDPVSRAMQILNEDMEGRIPLPDVARRVQMGYSAFRKRFARQAGISPRDYRIRRRIERAMALLTREHLLIKETAARLGYPDEYAFSAQFKRHTGLAPSAFRKRHA